LQFSNIKVTLPKKIRVMFKKTLALLILLLVLASCASRKDYVYIQNIDSLPLNSNSFQTVLQPDDLVSILVFGENSIVIAPYNSPNAASASEIQNGMAVQITPQTYLIANDNTINLLVIGKIKIGGLTKKEAENVITAKLSQYLVNPSIDMRILNYKVTVQGEVNSPGTFPVGSERITIIEALSLAGDLTSYGKRNNVLVIREQDGTKLIARLDLTQADFINSPYYYLRQNDMVYVEPNKTKINSAAVGPNTGIILSGISLLVAVIALTIR
jgi:polysaccharide export outer membrane protein